MYAHTCFSVNNAILIAQCHFSNTYYCITIIIIIIIIKLSADMAWQAYINIAILYIAIYIDIDINKSSAARLCQQLI